MSNALDTVSSRPARFANGGRYRNLVTVPALVPNAELPNQARHHTEARIQARAIRRAGELLKTFQSKGGRPPKTSGGTPTSSQRHAAEQVGMSKDQEEGGRLRVRDRQ